MTPPDAPRSAWSRATSLGPARSDHVPAARIALGLALPLAVLLLTDRIEWALYVGFGAFTGIYSRGEPTLLRSRRQALMGLVLTACVTLGSVLALLGEAIGEGAESWLALVIGALVAGGVAVMVRVRGIRPAGALFPLFALAAVSAAPPVAPIPVAALVAGTVAAFCVLLGLLGHWTGEAHPGAENPPPPVVPGRERAAEFALYAGVALVAGTLGLLSGIANPYWAQIAAIVPLSAPGTAARVERGLHRVVGTAAGVLATAFLLSFPAEPWQLVVWVVLLQFLTELFVLRHYALALLFITPLALLMVQLGHPQPVGPLLQARVLETVIGVAVGLAAVLARDLAARRRGRAASRAGRISRPG